MRKGILILTDVLHSEGAENVTVNIAVNLKSSGNYSPIVCATRRGGVLEDRLREHDIKCIKLNRKHRHEIYKFNSLKGLIRDENIRLIHSHKMGSNFWGVILGKLHGLPAVSHVHGQVYDWKELPVNRFIERLSSKIITVSEFERKMLITQIPADKVVTVYNGINTGKYKSTPDPELKRDLGLRPGAPVVGISAALRKEKAHETFLLAAREILKSRQDAHFLVMGDGARREELQRMASELGISKNCRFTGFVNKIHEYLALLDIGVLTSVREGLPLTLLEYMASSKPVVATNVGGVGEVVKDGVNGYLVPGGDHNTLAGRLNMLIDDRNLRAELGTNGHSLLEEKFSENKMMEKIVGIYDELTAAKTKEDNQ